MYCHVFFGTQCRINEHRSEVEAPTRAATAPMCTVLEIFDCCFLQPECLIKSNDARKSKMCHTEAFSGK